MSATSLLFIVIIAASILLIADSAIQWSLRVVLDGGFDHSRAEAEKAAATAAEKTPPSRTQTAKAA